MKINTDGKGKQRMLAGFATLFCTCASLSATLAIFDFAAHSAISSAGVEYRQVFLEPQHQALRWT